jgi:chloramphenicol 3-O phosphotransferase
VDARRGQVVILNGVPRSGKSSIAAAIQRAFDGPWLNIGVDAARRMTPERFQPGIGLRPGGERPDLEPFIVAAYAALYDSIAAHSRAGLNVVADFGHHDAYSRPLSILPSCARRLAGLPVLFVGVRCTLDVVMARRAASEGYVTGSGGDIPPPVRRWEDEVHRHGLYDLEVDTSVLTPDACAAAIADRMRDGPPGDAFARLASSN